MDIRGYAICTVPRSGSNFLCQLLTSTGRLGRPLEWFNGPARRTLDHPGYPDDPEAQIAAILDLGRTANGVYGVKLFPNQFAEVEHTRWTERLPNLQYIHLRRNDLLASALSWARDFRRCSSSSQLGSTGRLRRARAWPPMTPP